MKTQVHLQDAANASDRNRVEQILDATAVKFGLTDNTITSRVPDTIRSIVERQGYGFGIGGRVVNQIIIIDFFPNKSPSTAFPAIKEHIISELCQAFGDRVYFPKEAEHIPTRPATGTNASN